jgi:molybdopterin converting factor small subunit
VGRRGAPQDLRRLTPSRGADDVEVAVRLFANLAEYGPSASGGAPARVRVPRGATIDDLLRRLGIPGDMPRLLLVNGRDAEPTTRLGAGDVVDVLPPLAGG